MHSAKIWMLINIYIYTTEYNQIGTKYYFFFLFFFSFWCCFKIYNDIQFNSSSGRGKREASCGRLIFFAFFFFFFFHSKYERSVLQLLQYFIITSIVFCSSATFSQKLKLYIRTIFSLLLNNATFHFIYFFFAFTLSCYYFSLRQLSNISYTNTHSYIFSFSLFHSYIHTHL